MAKKHTVSTLYTTTTAFSPSITHFSIINTIFITYNHTHTFALTWQTWDSIHCWNKTKIEQLMAKKHTFSTLYTTLTAFTPSITHFSIINTIFITYNHTHTSALTLHTWHSIRYWNTTKIQQLMAK